MLSEQPFELDVTALHSSGMGLSRHEGKRLRVLGGLPGERVVARQLFGRGRKGQAETLEVLQASPDRVEPRCPNFGYCGACSLQHLSMQAQLSEKEAALLRALETSGGVEPLEVFTPLSGPQWNYRRKARLSVRDVAGKNRVLVGFRERNGRYVADMSECHVLHPEAAAVLPQLSDLIGSLEGRSTIPQIELACGDRRSALVIRHLQALSSQDLDILRRFACDTGLGICLQPAGADSAHALAPEDLELEYVLEPGALRIRFGPLDFIQVNGELNRLMVERALELLQPGRGERILDLFCGLGNFSLPLALHAAHVTGVEGSEQMVERGRRNARLNGIGNVAFYCADLYQGGDSQPWPDRAYDKVLLDPPRSGALELLPWIAAGGASRVLYISCNPETLARDAGVLVNRHGFSLRGAGVLNMFPHTQHSEAIALFERGPVSRI